MKTKYLTLFLFLISCNSLFSTSSQSSKPQDMKGLIIDGEGFVFMISEPDGWKVNIEDAKTKRLNAYFVIDGYSYQNTPGLIYIRVMDKQGLTVEQHLKADMETFSQEDKSVIFKEFIIPNLSYHYASKNYLIGDSYCDYLCYMDPGEKRQSYLIFVLSSDMKHCSKYNDVFRQFLESFSWVTDQSFDQTGKK